MSNWRTAHRAVDHDQLIRIAHAPADNPYGDDDHRCYRGAGHASVGMTLASTLALFKPCASVPRERDAQKFWLKFDAGEPLYCDRGVEPDLARRVAPELLWKVLRATVIVDLGGPLGKSQPTLLRVFGVE